MKTLLLLAFAAAAFAQNQAMDILHRTAETYQKLGKTEARVTIQTLQGGGVKVSERSATQTLDFDQIDQHVKSAGIARQEHYVVDGQPRPIYVVNVVRDNAPAGQFAMYRIDRENFHVYKVSTYTGDTTEIAIYTVGSLHAAEPASMVGTEAPDFILKDTAGKPVHLRDLRGKVVVVDFWATWCGSCRALMPSIQKMSDDLASKGLVILGLDVGEDAAKVEKFARQQNYTFRLLLDAEPEVTARYFVQAYPTTFVIGRDGRIAFRDSGGPGSEIRSAVEKALAVD